MTDFKMKYQIVADAAKAKAEVREFDDVLHGVGTKVGAMAGGAVGLAAGIAAVGGAAVTAGVALFNLTKNAADYGSEIYNASVKTGLSAETMSALKVSADRTGVSLESVGTIIGRFSKQIGEAAQGSTEAKEKLTRLGIDPQKAINDLDGALAQAIKQISAMESPVARATAAQQLFGKAGTELLKVIDDTKGDLPGLIAEAKRLGLTLSDEDARAADEFGDQLDILRSQLRGVQFTIGRELMPTFLNMASEVSAWLATNKGEIQSWANVFANALGQVGDAIEKELTDIRHLKVFLDNLFNFDTYLDNEQNLLKETMAFEKEMRAYHKAMGAYSAASSRYQAITRPVGTSGADYLANAGRRQAASSGDQRTDKQVYQDFVAELKKLGVTINSGFRTYAQQAALYAKLPKGEAAVPGTSDHEFYRAVDLPPNVSQAVLERAARAAGVVLEKRNVHQGTGRHNHQAFRKGRSTGGGEAAAFADAEAARKAIADATDFEREMEAALQGMAADMIAREQQASEERLAIRQKEADAAVNIIEGMVLRGELTEEESRERLGQLRLDMLEEEKRELEEQIPTQQNIQRLLELQLEISDQKVENENELLRINKQLTEEYEKHIRSLEKRNPRPGLKTRQNPIGDGSFGDRLDDATGRVRTMDDVMHQLGSTATDVFMQMGQAIGASVEAWVLLGDNADISLQKILASTLAGVAAQSAVLSIFHLAMGIAALTPWGAAVYGPAPLHFKAAAIWGAIAVGTALAGRAVAGDSGSSGAGGGSSSSSSTSGGSQQNQQPYSRQTDDVYISGRREQHLANLARAVEKLERKISGMNAGDVLVAGSRQRKGFIGTQAVDDMKTRPQLGSRLLRQTNAR